MDFSTPCFPVLHYLQEFAQTLVHCHPAISSCHPLLLPSIFPSMRVFSNESALHIRWPKYWSFSFSISSSMNIQGWFSLGLTGLVSLQSKESLLQHHSLKASVHGCSTFFMVHLSHPCVTTGKDIALIIWTFVIKVMSLLFKALSMFVIAFLPRKKRLLIHGCSHCPQLFWSPRR